MVVEWVFIVCVYYNFGKILKWFIVIGFWICFLRLWKRGVRDVVNGMEENLGMMVYLFFFFIVVIVF